MKHFLGGSAIGMIVALIRLPWKKNPSDYEFAASMAAHFFVAFLFGLAAWGLLP